MEKNFQPHFKHTPLYVQEFFIPILYSKLLYKIGQDLLDIQYNMNHEGVSFEPKKDDIQI